MGLEGGIWKAEDKIVINSKTYNSQGIKINLQNFSILSCVTNFRKCLNTGLISYASLSYHLLNKIFKIILISLTFLVKEYMPEKKKCRL